MHEGVNSWVVRQIFRAEVRHVLFKAQEVVRIVDSQNKHTYKLPKISHLNFILYVKYFLINFAFFSLINMYKELESDIPGFVRPPHGFLLGWAKQGKFNFISRLTCFSLMKQSSMINW